MPRLGSHHDALHPVLLHDTTYPLFNLLNFIFPIHPCSAHGAMSISPPSVRPESGQLDRAHPKHLQNMHCFIRNYSQIIILDLIT